MQEIYETQARDAQDVIVSVVAKQDDDGSYRCDLYADEIAADGWDAKGFDTLESASKAADNMLSDWLDEASDQAGDAPTSHRITMTIHPDLHGVIRDYADNNDIQSIGSAAAQICGIGAEALEGRTVQDTVNPWGGVREGSGRPAADDGDEKLEEFARNYEQANNE